MTDSAAILELRHCRVAEQATLQPVTPSEGEAGVFIAVDDPPPVRTVLAVIEGSQRRALEVASVVEVAERDEHRTRGFYGRWVELEALTRAATVGTEHLDDGTPVVQPVVPEDSAQLDVSDAPAMAMPAPVLIVEDDTGVVELRDTEDSSEVADATEAYEPEPAETTEAEVAQAEATEATEADDAHDYAHDYAEASSEDEASAEASTDGDDESKESAGRRRGGRKKRGRKRR